MKLHSMIIAGGAGLLLLGACSPSSYQTTFPEPAYVKVSTNNGAYAPYPDDPVGQQELVYWYNSLAAPMTVVAEVPPTPIVTTGPGPVVLDSSDFSFPACVPLRRKRARLVYGQIFLPILPGKWGAGG